MRVCSCSVQTGCHLVSVRLSSTPIYLHQGSRVALGKVCSASQAHEAMLLDAFSGNPKLDTELLLKNMTGVLQAFSVRENYMSWIRTGSSVVP